ncbi:MAG: hypothetical protein IT186_08685 [Acidobacteria bacterium]|nr:hypothetical protein [Acidobacteriota bacterium]MCG3192009.1 hypothetical protein [Thermoanaerobaculia bacterium]
MDMLLHRHRAGNRTPCSVWLRAGLLGIGILSTSLASTAAQAQGGGITLFTGRYLSGESQTFFRDEPDLRYTRIGAGTTKSVGVTKGCEATLYEFPGYQGNFVRIRGNDNNLDNTILRQNSVGSIKVSCPVPSSGSSMGGGTEQTVSRGWVTLFSDRRFTGKSETFQGDVPDLNRTRLGARSASSLRVAEGCTAILFEYQDYKGRSTLFREQDGDLGNSSVGDNSASSLRLYCGKEHSQDGSDGPILGQRPRYGATLFRDRSLGGPSETFDQDVPDLSTTVFGARRASSIDVTPGCAATLYEFPFFRGRSVTVRARDNNLGNTAVGEDTVSSLQVRCASSVAGPAAPSRGITLYRDRSLRGPSQIFDRDVPDLSVTAIGARTASSVAISPGCVAILFEQPGYQGRSTTFKDRDNNLANTEVGEDQASSLRIICN